MMRYRAVWRMVVVRDGPTAGVYAGDLVPAGTAPAEIERLLVMGAIEPVSDSELVDAA